MTKALFTSVPFFPTEVIKVRRKASFTAGRVVSSGYLPMGDDPLGLNPRRERDAWSRKAEVERRRRGLCQRSCVV